MTEQKQAKVELPSEIIGRCNELRFKRNIALYDLVQPSDDLEKTVWIDWQFVPKIDKKGNPVDKRELITGKIYPHRNWFTLWEMVQGPGAVDAMLAHVKQDDPEQRERAWKKCSDEARFLVVVFIRSVLESARFYSVSGEQLTFYVVSSFGGPGFYQLLPQDWKVLEKAVDDFVQRLGAFNDLKHKMQHPENHDEATCGSGCWGECDVDAEHVIGEFEEQAEEERETLCIEDDSEDEKEEIPEEEPVPADSPNAARIKELREQAAKLLEEARALAKEGSDARRAERRSVYTAVEIGTVA
ncbi:MAG: hypothetical protein KGL39_10400 [Patescibacteria group bacterium]|nr:hypothetical protein [Patescibacteria group bacterium]